jgi:ATP-binding cassette subfamily C protein CydCD
VAPNRHRSQVGYRPGKLVAMYFDKRLWRFTAGVRGRIAVSVVVGLAAAVVGVARLALLGWLIAQVFRGATFSELIPGVALVAGVIALRGVLEYLRTMIAHGTAARVQMHIRRALYDKAVALGPAWFGLGHTADVMVSVVDGVEQLETYFGQFLPQIVIATLTPVAVFMVVAWLDLPVALVLLTAALVTLVAPMASHRLDLQASLARSRAFRAFAAEFLDAVQGLATLKAFGQARNRAASLSRRAHELADGTRRVNATNALGRGLTDAGIAIGAATALGLGAYRVVQGDMSIEALLIVLMMGVELFRPLRDLRAQLHTGMLGQSAAQTLHRMFDANALVTNDGTARGPVQPNIQFDDVTFAYPATEEDVHDHLQFDIAAGERVGIVGASGSGKSSIVRLLLRFYDPTQGRICIDGIDIATMPLQTLHSVFAVVNQDTYLFHGTVEDNLRLGKDDATQTELEAAARSANAHAFISELPQGYRTVVGERGIKLSGGQRQRIAIARALLRDAPILVLDEALSAVDAENEAVIQDALDRLMVGRTTLVFAHRLSSIIGSDRILVLAGGRIVEQGTHSELIRASGHYHALMGRQAAEQNAGATLVPSTAASDLQAADRRDTGIHAAAAEPTNAIVRAQGLGWTGATRELLRFVTSGRIKLAFTFLFGITRVASLIGVGVLSALIVAAVKAGNPYGGLLLALAVAAPLAGVLHWLESWFAHDFAFKLLAEMRERLFDKLEQLAPAYLLHRRSGDLAAMATQDVETVESFYAHTLAPALVAILVPAAVLTTLLMFAWSMAAALLPFLAIVVVSPFLMRHRLDSTGSRAREALGELNAFAVDSIQGLAEIVAFEHAERRGDAFMDLIGRVRTLRLAFYRDLTVQAVALEVATGLGGLAMIVTGAALVTGGELDAGLLPLLTLLAMAAFMPISEIAHIGRQLADTLGAVRRLYAVENEPVAVADGPGVPSATVPTAVKVPTAAVHTAMESSATESSATEPSAIKRTGAELVLENVSFTYDGRETPALSDVSLTIPAGATVALVGPSGAGKTTLAHLLVRFWDPATGRILMDGHNLADYELDDLRQRVALVAQDTYLFNQTLAQNIRIAKPGADAAALDDAASRASLAEVIGNLPLGLDTSAGERGLRLSGGQRQRVAIARAFLKDAPVLILDEATSHLDAVNERAVRSALDDLMHERTTVVIAHRLSTVRDADLIVVMQDGRIVEQGQHDNLAASGGLYARLVTRQMSGVSRATGPLAEETVLAPS